MTWCRLVNDSSTWCKVLYLEGDEADRTRMVTRIMTSLVGASQGAPPPCPYPTPASETKHKPSTYASVEDHSSPPCKNVCNLLKPIHLGLNNAGKNWEEEGAVRPNLSELYAKGNSATDNCISTMPCWNFEKNDELNLKKTYYLSPTFSHFKLIFVK